MKIRILALRYQRRLAAPIMASAVTVAAALLGQTVQDTVDSLPRDCAPEVRTTGNAAFGGRPIQVCLSVVRRVTPPAPAVDVRYNWPPSPGLRLRVRVGVSRPDGRFEVNPAAGFASARTGITNEDGVIQVDYIPPREASTEIGTSGNPVVLWFEDQAGPIAATEIRLWHKDPSGAGSPQRWAEAPPQPERWSYRNSIGVEPLAAYFDRAAEGWNAAMGRHRPSATPAYIVRASGSSGPANLEVDAGYPTRTDEKIRSAFAVTELSAAGQAKIHLHLEYLNPDRRFRPFVPGAVTGLENIGRSFEPTLPLNAIFGTMSHELGHVLGLADTVDPESQASVMSQGRGRQAGNNFRFFVNEVFSPAAADVRAALALRERMPRGLTQLPPQNSRQPGPLAVAVVPGAAVAPPDSGGLRYLAGANLLQKIRLAWASQPRERAPGGAPAWKGTAWDTAGRLEFSVWPELDRVRVDAGPLAGACFRVPGAGRQVLLAGRPGAALVRRPQRNRRMLCDSSRTDPFCWHYSLRSSAERATYGEVVGFVDPRDDRAPLILIRVIRTLWDRSADAPTYLRVRWPVGTDDYSGADFPSPKLGDRLILFTCPEIAVGEDGTGRRTEVEAISVPLPFGAIAVKNGYTLPLTWLRTPPDRRSRRESLSSRLGPRARLKLFGARLSDLLPELEKARDSVGPSCVRSPHSGFRAWIGL